MQTKNKKNRIELERALELLTEGLSPLGTEIISVDNNALGRTLTNDFQAPIDQPPFDRSPLDGYAFRACDSEGASRETPVYLSVTETIYAGDVPKHPVGRGQAAKIMTGAMLPEGADCVLGHEDTDRGTESVAIFRSMRPHENYVDHGTDYRAGTVLLPAGCRLDTAAIGLLASAGLTKISVQRRPLISILSTGDEVVPATEQPLPRGKIYGSNLALLSARLAELGFSVLRGEHMGDDPEAVANVMRQMLESCDFLITTGGVSVGDKDIFHQVLPILGAERVFWQFNAKPGSPAMYSRYQVQDQEQDQKKPILSLSGNPFAAAATFELLARPILATLSGEKNLLPERRKAILDTQFQKASPIRRFVRGRYSDGHVSLPKGHTSGELASLVGCNCLVDIPAGNTGLAAGQEIEILLL